MMAVSVPGCAANEMSSSSVLLFSIVHVTPCTSRPPVRVAAVALVTASECAVTEYEVDVADRDDVAVVQHRRLDPGPVDEGAVDAAVVPDLGAVGRRDQSGVVA